MTNDSEETLKRIVDQADLPAMPEVFARLMGLFDEPETTAAEISTVLQKDAALVARILRVANSAYYARAGDVSTVQQAVMSLGFRTTKAIVLSSAVYSTVHKRASTSIDLRPYWQHGLEVAVTAMLIAEDVCPAQSDEAFVAGLLHDVGKVTFAMAFPDKIQELLNGPAGAWTMAREKELFGVDHSEAGAYLCRSWNLPNVLCEGISEHHVQIDKIPESAGGKLALCVGLANSMSSVSWAGPAMARSECRAYKESAATLAGITSERFQQIQAQVFPQMEEWADLLEIQVCDPMELLAAANQRLLKLYESMEQLVSDNEILHQKLLAEENQRAALEALKVICATFSHHINNATTTILGRAQLVNLSISNGADDTQQAKKTAQSMKVIESAVDTITKVLQELKELTRFETVSYHGESQIIQLKREIAAAIDAD
jgi:two-component system cell cycle response regulator